MKSAGPWRFTQYPRPPNVYTGMDAVLHAPPMIETRKEALGRVVAEVSPKLRSFVRRRVRDLADAEDIVQDALLELATAYGLAEPIERAAAWVARVAQHRIIDRYRAQSRAARRRVTADADWEEPERIIEQWLAPAADGPEGIYLRERFMEALADALQSLPPEQRAVFVAHEFDGKSFKALSADTGISVNTLLGRKHAAVNALRERLAHYQSWFDNISEYFP
jgi:RNA polymerase sigma factor (sigma-70 family)